ncbi:hypothetical protein C5167_020237 [Papaver somniferum]|uniref:Cytochrome P450 n=2 Tax=Papaver somniferum TaxID=3469 RepID=A0A4Y7ISG5_PAPSO|nr:hypothetical protein C5167_020237 [Papaver somniferum]
MITTSWYAIKGFLEAASLASVFFTLMPLIAPYWPVRKVPGPPTIPLLGHIHLLSRYGPDVFSVLAKQYGPVFSVPAPILGHPIHQRGLMFSNGTQWPTMRNTILSVYQPSHLSSLIPTMQSIIESATENLPTWSEDQNEEGEEDFIFSELTLKIASEVIGKASFGFDFGLIKKPSSEVSLNEEDTIAKDFVKQHIYSTTKLKMDLKGSFSVILGVICPILQQPFQRIWERIPGKIDWKVNRSNHNLSSKLDQIVEKRAKNKDRGTKDFLSLVLNARESDHERLHKFFTPDYVSALAYEQLLSGAATTSFTLSTILYLVADHPEVEKKLLKEIDGFGEHDLIPTAHDLQHKFPYLDQVLREAMRYYPTSPLIAREAVKDVEIGGYALPKGTWIWMAVGVLAQDPKNFPEPNKFRPERYDPTCEEEKQRHPYAFLPFGIGPRQCLGIKFTTQEMKLTLIHLYRRYKFQHSPKMERPLALDYGIIYNFKYGVKLRVIKRST